MFFPCTEELPPILRPRRIRLHVFVTSFKRKNDVTPSNAIHDVIFRLQMTSAITHFPRAFKAVNYCLIYYTVLTLALKARRVRILACKSWMMTLMHNIYKIVNGWSYLGLHSRFLLNAWVSQNVYISSVFFAGAKIPVHFSLMLYNKTVIA